MRSSWWAICAVIALSPSASSAEPANQYTHPHIELSIAESSTALTPPGELTLGESVALIADLVIPSGDYTEITLRTMPPPGLRLTGFRMQVLPFSGSVELDPSGPIDAGAGQTAEHGLGVVSVPPGTEARLRVILHAVADPTAWAAEPEGEMRMEMLAADTWITDAHVAIRRVRPAPVVVAELRRDAEDPDAFDLTAILYNPGDAPVCDLRLELPVPTGFRRPTDLDGGADAMAFELPFCLYPDLAWQVDMPLRLVAGDIPNLVPVRVLIGEYRAIPGADLILSPLDDGIDNNADGRLDGPSDAEVRLLVPMSPEPLGRPDAWDDTTIVVPDTQPRAVHAASRGMGPALAPEAANMPQAPDLEPMTSDSDWSCAAAPTDGGSPALFLLLALPLLRRRR